MEDQKYFKVEIPVAVENFTDFSPTSAGYSQCTPGHTKASITNIFLIHYVVSGKGTFTINNTTYHISAGNVFIIHPYQNYRYEADKDDPWYYIWISFDGKLAKNFLSIDYVHPFDEPEIFYNIRSSADRTECRTEYLCAQLMLIYCKLAPSMKQNASYPQIIHHQICSSYMLPLTVNDLAAYCNIHRNYASRLFKEAYGMSILDFLTQYRMQKSIEFLAQGYSVDATAVNVGYANYAVFSKKFKSFFGVSPSAYKTKISSLNIGMDKFTLSAAPKLEENLFYKKTK